MCLAKHHAESLQEALLGPSLIKSCCQVQHVPPYGIEAGEGGNAFTLLPSSLGSQFLLHASGYDCEGLLRSRSRGWLRV